MVGYSYVDEYKRLVRKESFREGSSLYSAIGDTACSGKVINGGIDNRQKGNDDDENKVQDRYIRYLSIENVLNSDIEPEEKERKLSKWKRKAMVSFSSYETNPNVSNFEHHEMESLRRSRSDISEESISENSQSITWSVWMEVRQSAFSLFFTYFCTLVGQWSFTPHDRITFSTKNYGKLAVLDF